LKGSTNRRKGHNFEREIAKVLREMGYREALTSRQASRLYDDCKLDIWGVPLNVQIKNVKVPQNPTTIIRQMKREVEQRLEPIEKRMDKPFVVIQKSNREVKVFVEMSLDDFKTYFEKKDSSN